MNRMIKILLFVLLSVVGWQTDAHADSIRLEDRQSYDMLYDNNALEHQASEAVLSDGLEVYRICNPRPQRIQPPHSFRQQSHRTTVRVAQNTVKHYSSSKLHVSDGRCRQESAPHPLAVSCHYYVIALRHLLR